MIEKELRINRIQHGTVIDNIKSGSAFNVLTALDINGTDGNQVSVAINVTSKLFEKKDIQFGFHYPLAIHQLKVFKKQFKNKKFKNAERIAKEGISIPIDPNLSKKNIHIIIRTLNTL